MRDNDRQLGKPMRVYRDTKANIEAIGGLGAADEGLIAYATDLNKFGRFGNSAAGLGWGWDVTFNVKAFGAVGDNIVDDRLAIQQTIDAAYNDGGGIVLIPPLGFGANDRYKIENVLELYCGVSLMGAHRGASRISAHGAFPILSYDEGHKYPDNGGWLTFPSGFFIKHLTLGFEDYYDNVAAKCINWVVANPQPSHFIMENVTLRNGYYGYYDTSTAFLANLKNVMINHCKNGIRKTTSAAITLDTCYVRGRNNAAWDNQAMYFGEASNPVIIDSSVDNWQGSDHICHFVWCPFVIIDGLGLESNTATGLRMLRFENCGQVDIAGLMSVDNTWPTGGAETDFIRFSDSQARLTACRLTEVTFTGAGGTGNTIALDDSFVTIAASYIPTPTAGVGAPTVVAIDMRTAPSRLSLDCTTIGVIDNAAGGSYSERHAGDGPL